MVRNRSEKARLERENNGHCHCRSKVGGNSREVFFLAVCVVTELNRAIVRRKAKRQLGTD